MEWFEVWPKQRANVTRKRPSADAEYRARVRKNKRHARSKAQAAEQKKERAARAVKRAENAAITRSNEATLAK